MRKSRTAILMAIVLSLTGCASWRGGPPSCDGSVRRPVGSMPDRTSLAPDVASEGDRHGQS
ncbi:hypothetical protein [Hyphomicrobium sp. 2TAF46]|uniref:hypothetical protein n=1 Tax=Hyphomicrobium sp. 2TAF46 TaxID=3233019 RepID=UPI003F916991